MDSLKETYWLTRIVFLRCLAFMYAVAFMVAYHQNESLIGENGLTPATLYLDQRPNDASVYDLMMSHPTIFWMIEPTSANLNYCAAAGLFISILVTCSGSANIPIMFLLWSLYFSIVTVGQRWYQFGWESQLLETGFLAMFMVPVLSLRRFPKLTTTPWVTIWGYRWLLFRIMIGAGMIKIRGDQCWRDLTCMNYHYQTQPVPNFFSIYFHNTPEWVHKLETLGNHIVELALPVLLLSPWRVPRILGGIAQIGFQIVLVLSGNLAFLNWLTALPAVACFDDAALVGFFSKSDIKRAQSAQQIYQETVVSISHRKLRDGPGWKGLIVYSRRVVAGALAVWLAYLSYPVVNNILSPNQAMNVSFGAFRIVNSYGAFGSITKVRNEVILQGTNESSLHSGTVWKDFEFTCKPGDINRRPCWISPYHIRIDWLMWFAAFQSYQHCPWLVHLSDKLLSGDDAITAQLLAPQGNPFAISTSGDSDGRPTFVRAELYEYQYPSLDLKQREEDMRNGWEVGKWWKRRHVTSYMPAVEANNDSVQKFLKSHRMIS